MLTMMPFDSGYYKMYESLINPRAVGRIYFKVYWLMVNAMDMDQRFCKIFVLLDKCKAYR